MLIVSSNYYDIAYISLISNRSENQEHFLGVKAAGA